jgi:hypothetical protein
VLSALLPRRAVGAAVSGEFHGLVAAGVLAHLALGAVSDADASLDDAVGAGGVRAFAADAFGFGAGWFGFLGVGHLLWDLVHR